ncbi:augmin complex subunit wac [Drosophila ficusphila]|uniref:augmin complex subunit wac n=1 Tax=Drosophila ficusphila TaxID=30025 RepID=UPI0007E5E3D1|nr:augmin complex subunit wac [Drosophila ficusphila]
MQHLKLQEEIKELKGIGLRFEQQLKLASVEIGDFSDEDLALLDKCVQYYEDNHIHEFSLNYLRDFYYAKKRDCIENKQTRLEQSADLQRINSALDEAVKEVAMLERFKCVAEERFIPESVVLQRNSQQHATKEELLDRQRALKIPNDFKIESVIEKVGSLERR